MSWRYSWLEGWVFDYLVTVFDSRHFVRGKSTNRTKIDLEVQLTGVREKSAQAQAELMRLLRLEKSSNIPPETLLQEMQQMEKEQKRVGGGEAELEARIEATAAGTGLGSRRARSDRRKWHKLETDDHACRCAQGNSTESFEQSMYSPTVFPGQQLGDDAVTPLDCACLRMTERGGEIGASSEPDRPSTAPTEHNGTVPWKRRDGGGATVPKAGL